MENSWDWCLRELWCCQGINSDLKIQNGSQELSEDAHSPTLMVVDFRPCNALLLNLKFRLVFPRPPWLPCLAVAQPGPSCLQAPKSWTTETCFQSTLGFPPLLLSLEFELQTLPISSPAHFLGHLYRLLSFPSL